MKTTRLLLVLSIALLALSACSKSDEPLPPPEVPVPENEFKDTTETMEEHIEKETQNCYYNYFRFQNDSDHTIWFYVATRYTTSSEYLYIRPKEQATYLITLAMFPITGLNDPLVADLSQLGRIEFYVNAPAPGEFPPVNGSDNETYQFVSPDVDTLAIYNFYDGLEPNSKVATPKDAARWKIEKVTKHRVRWTYRITNGDHDEAVRQTLERWKDKPKK